MARPMILLHKSVIDSLYHEYTLGVPVRVLMTKYASSIEPAISYPTFSKIIRYYDTAMGHKQAISETKDAREKETLQRKHDIIMQSLFPAWLSQLVQTQPTNYRYEGLMLYGKWICLDDIMQESADAI